MDSRLSARAILEIACDESGSEGEKLVGGQTDVFAHAGVHLSAAAATRCVEELRARIGSPATEYKANHLLRRKHRAVLEWILGSSGPIYGNARVQLVDKAFFIVSRLVDLVAPAPGDLAVILYRAGARTFGPERWAIFLDSFNDLLRIKNRRGTRATIDSFFALVDDLHRASEGRVHDIMGLIRQARPRVAAFRTHLFDDPTVIPPMDPLIPALVQTVRHWSAGGTPVAIIHDETTALTEERITQLQEMFSPPSGRLTSLTLVDSRSDARVQVADYLAGVARKIASDELNNRGDPVLTALLRPYVDPTSIWVAAA